MLSRRYVGSEVRRLEDPRLIRGQAQYIDDIVLPGVLHATVLRSPWAHALLVSVDVSAAANARGVLAVLTGQDLKGKVNAKPLRFSLPGFKVPPHLALALGKVTFVGQPVAFILAAECALARDAADLVRVEYDPLDPVVDPEDALKPGAPQIYAEVPGNLAFEHSWSAGPIDDAFARADRVIRGRFVNQRLAPTSLEPRGCVAIWQAGALTLWTSTQMPHRAKSMLAETLGLLEHRIRVIAPEVGGGFGSKIGLYDEEILVAFTAMTLARPVKWIEQRSESFAATTHGRGQIHEAELAIAGDGAVRGLRVTGTGDLGAHLEALTAGVPLRTGQLITGAYRIPAASYAIRAALTTKTPTAAYRGAGRPEASYIIERMMDLAAAELGMDPVDIRKKNFIRPEDFPYRIPSGLTYDSGRYVHRASNLPPGMEPGLEANRVFDPPDFTVPFGVYIAVVEVLLETGEIELLRFIGVDDVGNILNPLILEGQLHGGIAQGVAQALWEEVVYGEAGELVSGSLMDYAAPKADQLPVFELDHTVTPTPNNPLGAKGAGEAGCIGAPQAVVNAVLDALSPFGVRHLDMPLRPEKVWRATRTAV